VGTLRLVLDITVDAGARYDNPPRFIERLPVMPKKLHCRARINSWPWSLKSRTPERGVAGIAQT
jgi:hypothetical protein